MEKVQFKSWAIVELLGHQRMAGEVEEVPMAGTNMLQITVPETANKPSFTRYVSGNAVYAINPVSEEIARSVAESIDASPVHAYELREAVEKAGGKIVRQELIEKLREINPQSANLLGFAKSEDDDSFEDQL